MKNNRKIVYPIFEFAIGEIFLLTKLFTNISLLISSISLLMVLFIMYYVLPKSTDSLRKNDFMKKILSRDFMYIVILIIFVFLYYQFLNSNYIYFFYIILNIVLISHIALYQIKRLILQ